MAWEWGGGGSSRADQLEHLVAATLHVLARDEALEVEPQQRLGVRGPDVEVPVGVVDRDAVQAGALPVAVAPGQLLHPGVRVGHLGVDLSRDEVARAEAIDELAEL